jgi:hypothetical protein
VLARRTAADIVEIGRRLIAVKKELRHGQFMQWADKEFSWSLDTAQDFMQIAEAFSEIGLSPNLQIDAKALLVFSGPLVPEPIRVDAIEKAQAGEHITKAKAEEMVAEAVATAKRLTAEQKEQEFREAFEPALDRIFTVYQKNRARAAAARGRAQLVRVL